MEMHPPAVIFGLLAGLGVGCALLAGYSLAQGTRRTDYLNLLHNLRAALQMLRLHGGVHGLGASLACNAPELERRVGVEDEPPKLFAN